MKKMIRICAAVAAVVFAASAMTGCGDSKADKLARLDRACVAVDSVLKSVGEPVGDVDVKADDMNMMISLSVKDSMINVSRAGDEMVDYFMAQQLKSSPKDVVNETVKSLEATGGSAVVTVADLYGNSRKYTFTPETLRHLIKAKGSELNAPRVKEQLCEFLGESLANKGAYAQADGVELSVDKSFLTYTVTFASDRTFAGSGQGLLTRLYMEPIKAQFGGLGSLEMPLIEMCKSLSIDGECVIYRSLNGDKEIRQAFPWRIITE